MDTLTCSRPIGQAETVVADEAVVDCRDVGSPHQDQDAGIVEPVAKLRDRPAVVAQEVKSGVGSACLDSHLKDGTYRLESARQTATL